MHRKSNNMKKVCLIGFFSLLCYTVSFTDTLRIAKVESNTEQNVASKILDAIYQRLDVPVRFVELPGQRALELSSTGAMYGEVIRIFELETMYPSLVRVPTPYYFPETVVFSKKYDFEVSRWTSLLDYRVGIARGMKYYEIQLEGAEHLEKVNDVDILMQMLDLNRVDIVSLSTTTFMKNIKTWFPKWI